MGHPHGGGTEPVTIHSAAGHPLEPAERVDIEALLAAYGTGVPDTADPAQRVSFGTSGHRGTSGSTSFNERHILAITQAVVELRTELGITGPLFLGMDTHALSEPARQTALEVLAAARVRVHVDEELGYTPTPVVSHAILSWNRRHPGDPADGIVITPSHNPPEDGGFKYNPPSGGPADTDLTRKIQDRANELLEMELQGVKRISYREALASPYTYRHDFVGPYVKELSEALDLDVIGAEGIRIGADPMGGAGIRVLERVVEEYGIRMEVVNPTVDPTFGFMPRDSDGVIRMDCSSPWAMSGLVALKDRYDLAFGNDPDVDRHGIVTPSGGLMNPNHYLAVAVDYLFRNRSDWSSELGIGKTLVSSSMLDRVAAALNRPLVEVPVGFKWFVEGLLDGTLAFAGEESAGATFLRRDGLPWTTDKDGILLALLAAEMTARTGRDPSERYRELEEAFGAPLYRRAQAPASPAQKAVLKNLDPAMVKAKELAGSPIRARLTRAPGNDAPIGGLKVVADDGWFAARPSGTEEIYKIYAESFRDEAHLGQIVAEAQAVVTAAFQAAGVPT
ncbi:MAG: alpha-D-glucose phosphate-specific phosphoglucomutase [Gemmatimonadales bacterium]|nr:MAG: alpha-D-glucose phosphate-specific phosphoglucomutase [Gemmatimonadales bacterium]